MAFFHAEVTAKEMVWVDASKPIQVQETYSNLPYFLPFWGQESLFLQFIEGVTYQEEHRDET